MSVIDHHAFLLLAGVFGVESVLYRLFLCLKVILQN